ncbi:hypothetical protein ACO2Q9_02750 [Variovorax sp. VNK109]|uniref:hypothetical protein n=1 Tax=Variovorax sp. VNK109 TaxID=3400919 RepID=UPI003C0EBD98
MITTLHGKQDLLVYPTAHVEVSPSGRVQLCTIRGEALGRKLNVAVHLDVNTGEVLLFSPKAFVGTFRLGDLVMAQLTRELFEERRELQEMGGGNAAQAH